jgi:two-component system response regulator AtoC
MPAEDRILLAEDERIARVSLAELLESQGYRVTAVEDGAAALSQLLNGNFDAVLLDLRMPEMDGLTVLRKSREAGIHVPVIVMTAVDDSTTVIEAMRLGAYDYISKPIDFDQISAQLERAISHSRLSRNSEKNPQKPTPAPSSVIVGRSPAMQHVYKLIGQVAASDSTVLIRGESGTGKELVVNAIHHNSMRANGPLVKVNCAALPEMLLEAELFGHEKGAFTHAVSRRIGRFEHANGGTLFLDEIGELAPQLQSKLLRAVQERTIERLGSNIPIRVDLRLIAATSRNLEQAVAEGKFREDLYYRLSVVVIELPPLRERRQDIPALVEHFLHRGDRHFSITPAALNLLCEHDWPGNVRELENTLERAMVLARTTVIDADHIQLRPAARSAPLSWTEQIPLENGWKTNIAAAEKAMISRALKAAEGNKSKAAALLGIHRRLLYEKMREHKMTEAQNSLP